MRFSKSILFLLLILLFALPSVAQRKTSSRIGDRDFYLDEPFKRPAKMPKGVLKSGKECLNGVDNDWFWIFHKTGGEYRLALTGSAITVSVLKTRTHGLRDIETNAATANTNYSDIYKFSGSVYKARRCTEASPVTAKPKRVPCRTQ